MDKYWVVVVDDDVFSLKTARNLLNGDQVRVSVVRSGPELLTFMKKNEPDVILLDVMMPGMDGFETYRELRDYEEREERRQTPVIFLTGDNDSQTERRSLTIGASDFIRKPFDKDIMLSRIVKTVQNSRTIENLTEEASLDQLTGFLNKASGTAKVEELCRTSSGVFMIIDLDNFKLVNDLFGHETGDKVLSSFADIIRKNTRSGDVLCRIGGDEFLAFYQGAADEKVVRTLTNRLNEQLVTVCMRLMGEDFGIPIGVSIGCALVPEQGNDYQSLFRMADKTMYQVKLNGKHGYAVYDPFLETRQTDGVDLQEEMVRITKIVEERGEYGNAMRLSQDAFSWVYRYIVRFIQRYKDSAVKLLFALSPRNPGDEDILPKAAEEFGDLLQRQLRKSDIILQSKPNQFFLLLPETLEKYASVVAGRVTEEWKGTEYHSRIGISYVEEGIDHSF